MFLKTQKVWFNMQTKRIKLLILWFLLSEAECGLHSLVFMSTGRVQPGDRPAFEQLTVFDGVPISHCDGSTVDLKPALESKHLPDHCQEAEFNILDSFHEIPLFINITISVVQRRRGCILSATGTVSGFEAWSVDGMDFMTFDPESRRWTSQSSSAVTVELYWNKNQEMNVAFSWFIREQCPQMIQMIKLRSIIPKTELYVFGKPMATPGQALLTCHLMSTDRSSSLHLITDQTSRPIRITETGPVPAEDRCVILRLTAVISLHQNKYGCLVQTEGHNTTVFWDGNTLDGRKLLHPPTKLWKLLTVLFGVTCVGVVTLLISCATALLFKCVKMKKPRPPEADPQLVKQFQKLMRSVSSPDLQSILVVSTSGSSINKDIQEWWFEMMALRDQDYYDPDYFGPQVNECIKKSHTDDNKTPEKVLMDKPSGLFWNMWTKNIMV